MQSYLLAAALGLSLPLFQKSAPVCVVSRKGDNGKFNTVRVFPRWRKTAKGDEPIPAIVDVG